MVYAMLYAENADIIGTYDSRDAALADLASMVNDQPDLRDELGLRPYENGWPAGEFQSAGALLGDVLAQQQLDLPAPHRPVA
jgi:hypothetical protein